MSVILILLFSKKNTYIVIGRGLTTEAVCAAEVMGPLEIFTDVETGFATVGLFLDLMTSLCNVSPI